MANLAFSRVGRCYVLVQNKNTASDEEWGQWVAFVSKGGETWASSIRVLIFSAGGSPTPKQRGVIHKLMPSAGGGVTTAVVTASFIGRTIVSAMGLFNEKVRAFSPDRTPDALDYLGIATTERAKLLEAAARLHEQLGLPFASGAARVGPGSFG